GGGRPTPLRAGFTGGTFSRKPPPEGEAPLDVRSGALPTRRGGKPHPPLILSLVTLAANRAAREGGRVGVSVVGAWVRAEARGGGARVRRRHAALLDVAGARRRCGRNEQRHDNRAGDADRCLVDVAGDERLVVLVQDLGLELDRAVLAHLNQRVALGGRGLAGRFVLSRQLRVPDAHRAVTGLRRCPARGKNRR